jgi:hypothetical protein
LQITEVLHERPYLVCCWAFKLNRGLALPFALCFFCHDTGRGRGMLASVRAVSGDVTNYDA